MRRLLFCILTVLKSVAFISLLCLAALIVIELCLRFAFIESSKNVPFISEKESTQFFLENRGIVHSGNISETRQSIHTDPNNSTILIYGDELFHHGPTPFEFYTESEPDTDSLSNASFVVRGVSGAGPDQYLLQIASDIKSFSPKAVFILINTHNDYGDIIRNRLFELDSKDMLVDTKHTIMGVRKEHFESVPFNINLFFLELLKKRGVITEMDYQVSIDPQFYDPIVQEATLLDQLMLHKQNKSPKYSHFDDSYDLDISININSQSAILKLALMKAVIQQINLICEKEETSVFFILIPSSTDLITHSGIDYKELKAQYSGYMRVHLTRPLVLDMKKKRYKYDNLFPKFYKFGAESLYDVESGYYLSKDGVKLVKESILDLVKTVL